MSSEAKTDTFFPEAEHGPFHVPLCLRPVCKALAEELDRQGKNPEFTRLADEQRKMVAQFLDF